MKSVKLPQAMNEIRLQYTSKVSPCDRPLCLDHLEAHRIFRDWWDADCIELYEEFNVLLLDRARRAIGIYRASSGGTTSTIVDPKLVFSAALKCKADTIIVAHNHPSGNLQPSPADIAITKKLVEAGKLLDLPVSDHIILSPQGGCFSFQHEGMI